MPHPRPRFDPSGGASEATLERRIVTADWKFDGGAFDGVSSQAKGLISSLLSAAPDARPSAAQLLASPWVGGNAPDAPLPNSHTQLRAFNDARRSWRLAAG